MPSPFITDTNIQFAWDSTSLGWLKECPRKYQYAMIEGFRRKETKLDLIFGIEYHHALEVFDRLRASGIEYDLAMLEMLREAVVRTAEWTFDDPNKNRFTLFRSIIWYCEEFRTDPLKTEILADGKPAVELSFTIPIEYEYNGTNFLLCGHIDRLVNFGGDTFVSDRKTSKNTIGSYYFEAYDVDNQMSLYSYAGSILWHSPIKGVIIDAVQLAQGFSDFRRGTTFRTEAQLDEWLNDAYRYFDLAVEFANANHWPMNDKACRMCEFKSICAKDPRVRSTFLASSFDRNRWNPLERR